MFSPPHCNIDKQRRGNSPRGLATISPFTGWDKGKSLAFQLQDKTCDAKKNYKVDSMNIYDIGTYFLYVYASPIDQQRSVNERDIDILSQYFLGSVHITFGMCVQLVRRESFQHTPLCCYNLLPIGIHCKIRHTVHFTVHPTFFFFFYNKCPFNVSCQLITMQYIGYHCKKPLSLTYKFLYWTPQDEKAFTIIQRVVFISILT